MMASYGYDSGWPDMARKISAKHDAAVRAVEESQTMRLGAEDGLTFAEALINPQEPSARLKAAALRYLKLSGS